MATHAVPGTGLELILNAAEGVLQIVVTEDEAILCAQEWYRSERATEILAPALAELATSLGIRWSDLRRIACVRGPGSFTGIRLTLATAAALRRCGRAQLAGLDYMQSLATTAVMRRGMLYGGHVWVLTHARRNLVHCQPFISYGPEIPAQPLQGVSLCTPAEAVAAIRQNYMALYGVEELSEQLGVTKSHLVRVFKQEMGVPPGKYMTNVRIEAVKTLLLTDEYNLDMIAGLTGFSGANYLCRVFKREVGLSPAAWRTAAAPLPAVPKLPPRSQEMYV